MEWVDKEVAGEGFLHSINVKQKETITIEK